MADTVTTVTIVHGIGQDPGIVADRLLKDASNAKQGIQAVARELADIGGGIRGGDVTVAVESSTAIAATLTLTADQSDATAGDTLDITVPGIPTITITVVASGGTNSAGEVSADAASDDAFGAEIAAVFNTYPPLKRHFTAANVTGTVTVTARRAGAWANSITAVETADSNSPFAPGASTFAGGVDRGAAPTGTVTLDSTSNNIVEDDTVTIGSVTLTWKGSPSGENQVAFVNTTATDVAALAAKIAAHSKLQGIVDVSSTSAAVTLTWLGNPRSGQLIATSRAETNSGSVTWGAAALASGSTEAYQAAPVTYVSGG